MTGPCLQRYTYDIKQVLIVRMAGVWPQYLYEHCIGYDEFVANFIKNDSNTRMAFLIEHCGTILSSKNRSMYVPLYAENIETLMERTSRKARINILALLAGHSDIITNTCRVLDLIQSMSTIPRQEIMAKLSK